MQKLGQSNAHAKPSSCAVAVCSLCQRRSHAASQPHTHLSTCSSTISFERRRQLAAVDRRTGTCLFAIAIGATESFLVLQILDQSKRRHARARQVIASTRAGGHEEFAPDQTRPQTHTELGRRKSFGRSQARDCHSAAKSAKQPKAFVIVNVEKVTKRDSSLHFQLVVALGARAFKPQETKWSVE